MKHFFLILALAAQLLPLAAQNTEFAPIGARWMRIGYDWGSSITEVSTAVGDTIIMGNVCRIIQIDRHLSNNIGSTTHQYNAQKEYVYTQGSQVYYYRNGAFYTLYNFDAQVGDTWTVEPDVQINAETGTVQVDSIGTEMIDGQLLRYLWVSPAPESCYGFYYAASKIIERVGTVQGGTMFPNYGANNCLILDQYYGADNFRCYQDNNLFYGEGDSCVYVVDVQTPTLNHTAFNCYYNALSAELILTTDDATAWEGNFALYDPQGKTVANQALNPHQATHQVALSPLPAGIYAYTFSNSKGVVLQRGKVAIVR